MKKLTTALVCLMIGLGCFAQANLETDSNYPTGYIKGTTPYHFGTVNGVLYVISGNSPYILVRFPAGDNRSSFTIPNTVARIARGAFAGCRNLKELSIPSSMYYIGDNAFDDTEIEKFKVQGYDTSAISAPASNTTEPVYFDLTGLSSPTPFQGLNIVVSPEGTEKVLF